MLDTGILHVELSVYRDNACYDNDDNDDNVDDGIYDNDDYDVGDSDGSSSSSSSGGYSNYTQGIIPPLYLIPQTASFNQTRLNTLTASFS